MTPEQLAALERERLDISYRRKPPVAVEQPPAPATRRQRPKWAKDPLAADEVRRARERAIYQAGRYAAGARDPEAVAGFRILNTERRK